MMMMSRNKATADQRYASFTIHMYMYILNLSEHILNKKKEKKNKTKCKARYPWTYLSNRSFFYSMYVYAIISCFIRFLAYWLDRLRITEPFSPVVFSPNKMINCLSFFHFSFRSFNHCCRLLICSKAEMWKEKGKKCERIKLHHTSFFTTHSLIVVMM